VGQSCGDGAEASDERQCLLPTGKRLDARQQGQSELVQQALDRKRDYENALAKLQEFKVDNS
jgi:hypothetical protein